MGYGTRRRRRGWVFLRAAGFVRGVRLWLVERGGGEDVEDCEMVGGRTSSPSVSQKERAIRVTTLPGAEGVPRWSSLGFCEKVWGGVYGLGGMGWDGEVRWVFKWERGDGPGLPESTDVVFYVSGYSAIWERESEG